MKKGVQSVRVLARTVSGILSAVFFGLVWVAPTSHAAISDMFDLTDASGFRGDVVEVHLVLTQEFTDFEALDFLAPQIPATVVALHQAPALGAALPPSWVFAPPTLGSPKLGVANTLPGEEALFPGVLATYRFRILDSAPLGVSTVTIPFSVDESDVLPSLTAQISVIPEPGKFLMVLAGLGFVAWVGRRRAAAGWGA
jgi:hypothetical protein